MAYPTSVTTFTTKTSGQTIDESHVNDLQTEVNAIESGLLDGVAHDLVPLTTSSRSLGNSTRVWREAHASTVHVDVVHVAQQINGADFVRVTSTASLAVPNDVWTAIEFTVQETITNSSLHSTATNPSRLTPQSSGNYLFTGRAMIDFSTNSFEVNLRLRIDGSTNIMDRWAAHRHRNSSAFPGGSTASVDPGQRLMNFMTMGHLTSTQYVELEIHQRSNDDTSAQALTNTGQYPPMLAMVRI